MKARKCRVEVIDSEMVAGVEGLIVLAAAQQARKGLNLDQLLEFTRNSLKRAHFVVYLDTLKYLSKGGRIGKAQSLLGSVLSIKPILNIKGGEIAPLSRVRSASAGVAYLDNYRTGFKKIEAVMIEHTTSPDNADKLVELIKTDSPKLSVLRSTVCPVLGVYAGPNAFAISLLEKE
jgi:DegV family protein with EDD domain